MRMHEACSEAIKIARETGCEIKEIGDDIFPLEIQIGEKVIRLNMGDLKTEMHPTRELWQNKNDRALLFQFLTMMAHS
jgi:hypothetical protein